MDAEKTSPGMTTMPPQLSTADAVLRYAAEYIETWGWTFDRMYDWPEGQQYPSACATGAIYAAMGDVTKLACEGIVGPGPRTIQEALWVFSYWISIHTTTADIPANINVGFERDHIIGWNDDSANSADEVIGELRAAAAAYYQAVRDAYEHARTSTHQPCKCEGGCDHYGATTAEGLCPSCDRAGCKPYDRPAADQHESEHTTTK